MLDIKPMTAMAKLNNFYTSNEKGQTFHELNYLK